MKPGKTFVKRRYFDFRTGNSTFSPAIQLSNFLMLAYLTISELLPMYIFAPVFVVSIVILFSTIGSYFRKIQTPTDINMGYEKSTEAATTVCRMMEAQMVMMDAEGIKYPEGYKDRYEYMKRIGEGKV